MLSIFLQSTLTAIFLALAALLGYAGFEEMGAAYGTGLAAWALLTYHGLSAHKLLQWSRDFRLDTLPNLSGWWEDLGSRIYRSLRLQQRQQQALSHALIAFRSAAQALPDGVVTLDSDKRIQWFNDTAAQHLKIRALSDIGHPLTNFLRTPAFFVYLEQAQWDKPLILRANFPQQQILSLQIVRYGDQQLLVLTRDVTQLEKLETMRRDFVANVSHELKTPLTVLSGFLETFRDMPLDAQQRSRYVGLMHDQAQRMQHLVEDLLTLSSLESSTQAMEDRVDMHAIMDRLRSEAQSLSKGRHRLSFEHSGPQYIKGSEEELFSAFSNLISNAIRYTPENGSIDIRWNSGTNHEACLQVRDSGIGIEAQHIPRLTERFYRVDRSRSRASGGTGLGLAIVKHVLTRHGGHLTIESELGKGSAFFAILPARCRDDIEIL
ncbi:MAG: phosphate regulon sensor histidine kinase PhoR [Burkholderiaceae bacterium]